MYCIRGADLGRFNGNFWIGRKVPSLHSDVQEYARGLGETSIEDATTSVRVCTQTKDP